MRLIQRCRLRILLMTAVLFVFSRYDRLVTNFARTVAYLPYVYMFTHSSPSIHDAEKVHNRLEFLNVRTSDERTDCLLGNINGYLEHPGDPVGLDPHRNELCNPITIVPVGTTAVYLPTLTGTDGTAYRGESQLEFRRNGIVWGYYYFADAGFYRLRIMARCLGPSPAMLQASIDEFVSVFRFETEPQEYQLDGYFAEGLHRVALSFVNDYQGEDGDRNLEIIEVWIEH